MSRMLALQFVTPFILDKLDRNRICTDHRVPFVLTVPLDLSAEDFLQCIHENVPGVPAEFELCGERPVDPLHIDQPGMPSRERPVDPLHIDQPGMPSRERPVDPLHIDQPGMPSRLALIMLFRFTMDNVNTERPMTVAVRRQNVLKSACSVLSRGYFEWQREPRIEFINEMADDYGGPRREFQRLLMMAIQGTFGVFEGRSDELYFSYDLCALEQQKYFKAGKLTAWSVAHGGPGPRSISRVVYLLMCGQSAPLSDVDIGVLLDEDKGGKLQQVTGDLQRLKGSCGDWVSDCGVPSFYSVTLQEMPQVVERVVANYCFHRKLAAVSANFLLNGGKLTRQTFRGLFLTDWSPEGSNDREEEEETIFQYDDWLIKVEEGEVDATFEDLLVFVTGADHPPALGFPSKCQVHFFSQEPGTRRLPYASTCALFLYLPRGVREEEDFADLMSTALVGSLGFGKV
ncbi:G2/M phase-specific E3 ubiquitin-protein ligase [Merluccius polli]|uniref:G2/M phase-specific E3 ubiquitin-protein ligase n=1 Tax=Merluccius polli TaxID=89951 RepID=A0AA47M4B0_MERPO|nr:G2/M phase-specific E3 ubiquitin-protein ligase [Merluccius polli]